MRTFGFTFLVLACLCMFLQTGDATIRRVPSQYATIQAGINAAVHGDTVLVSDGTYYENIRFRGKRILVASTYVTTNDTSHIANTIIDGSNPSLPDSGSVVYFINGEDTTSVLRGFTITGGTGTSVRDFGLPGRAGGGILVKSGARISHNRITRNMVVSSLQAAWGGGIEAMLDSLDYIIVEHNQITYNVDSTSSSSSNSTSTGAGIDVAGLDAVGGSGRIVGNTIMGNRLVSLASNMNANGGGMCLYVVTFLVSANVIAGNITRAPNCTTYPCWGGGVMIWGAKLDFMSNRVTDNVVETPGGGRGGGISATTESVDGLRDALLSGNYIAFNKALGGIPRGGGVCIRDTRPRMENNIIVSNSAGYGGALSLQRVYTLDRASEMVSPRFKGLHATQVNRQSGLILPAPVLINNTIAYNRATIGLGGGVWSDGSWSPIVLNTIVWGDTCTQEIYLYSGNINVQYCDVQGGYAGTGNINADPRFVGTTFQLSNNSPCIAIGRDSVQIGGVWYRAPSMCYQGTPRPNPPGSFPDLGACESPLGSAVDGEESLPAAFALEQNYPNPFNPSTTISYGLRHTSFVTLTVYNTLGQQVAQLVNEQQQAGYHQLVFRGDGLASGVYFYRIQAGDFIASRKLLLLK